jgi:N-acetyl-gamma-glutamylphosphate reductase
MKAAVVGASATSGASAPPAARPSGDAGNRSQLSHAGRPTRGHPALAGIDGTFQPPSPGESAGGSDVVFLCLDHGEADGVVDEIFAARPGIVCDLSADFRIRDRDLHERHYGPRRSVAADRFVYALADVLGPELHHAVALAIPGCFATAAQLALWPLARLDPEGAPVLFAVTGSSGAGAKLKPTTHTRPAHDLRVCPLGHRTRPKSRNSGAADRPG